MSEEKEYEYTTISIPSALAEEIDKLIKENEGLGYKSRSEFVKQVIRNEISKIKNSK